MDGPSLCHHALDDQDLAAELRFHGLTDLADVRLATLERNGRISIIKAK